MKFDFVVIEVLRKKVRVEADSVVDAAEKVMDLFSDGRIELGDGDMVERQVSPLAWCEGEADLDFSEKLATGDY